MKQGNRRLLLFVLVVAIILLAAWFSLPALLRNTLDSMLDDAGYVLETLDLRATGLTETRIERIRVTAEDGSLFEIDGLVATYTPAGLASGSLAGIKVDSLLMRPSSRKQPLAKLLQGLVALMEQDLRKGVPVSHLRLDEIRIALATGNEIKAELTLQKDQQSLLSVVNFQTPEKPVLRFRQEEAGNWWLEASNSEEDAFATMTFERGREYPLALQADTDLVRIRQWSALFGIPLPAHNAATSGLLRLKPDGEGRQATFMLSGTASGIDEPQLVIERANTNIKGTVGWSDHSSDLLISMGGELSMQHLDREQIDAGQLDFSFSGDLSITGRGLAGNFAPGLLIDAKAFSLETVSAEDARLVSLKSQSFSWERRDRKWQFGPANYDFTAGTIRLGESIIHNSNYALAHDTWEYPLTGQTGFTLDGSSSSITSGTLKLSGISQKHSGSVTWPVNGEPPAIGIDLDVSAAELESGALFAKDLTITAPLLLMPAETLSIRVSRGVDVSLRDLTLGDANMEEVTLQLLTQLDLLIPSGGETPPLQGVLKLQHGALTHPEFHLEPGVIDLALDEADPETGTITGNIDAGAPVFKAAGTQWETSEVSGNFTLSADALRLEGGLLLDNTASRISYTLTHAPESNSGQIAFSTAAQPVQTLSAPLRKLGAPLPAELQFLSGSATLAGEVHWKDGLESISTTLQLKNTGGRYGEAYFSGLENSFDLALYPVLSGQSTRFKVAVIDLGVPITNLTGRISLEADEGKAPVITLSRLKAGMLDGTVRGNRVRIDLNRQNNRFTLAFDNISIAELVRLQQFEDIDAIGNLSGTLPITIGPAGLSITKGKATANTPGGYIRYRPKDGGELFGSSSMETEMLLKALDDYQYKELDADVAYKPDGQLMMQLQMKGRSPGLHATRPLHLNLNLDQNILSLIESLRAVDGLNDRIDRAVKQHFKAHNR